MPPKQCAKCTKTVYPTEELKCLDKVWHKGCFKCQVCNMTLNMKNYKGYEKLPYCNAHYPQTKFTAVADTPENRRISENTKIQSNIHYHKDFDANKDRYTQVADTPEMRALNRNKEYSMIKYHEEFEKQIKGKKITVADDPEVQRVRQNMNVISNVTYHGERDRKEEMERIRPAEQVEAGRHRQNPGRIADYDPDERIAGGGSGGTPYSNRNSAGARQVYDSSVGRAPQRALAYQAQQYYMEQPQSRKVGSIHDYDPLNENYGSIAGQSYQDSRRDQAPPQQPYQPPQQQYQPPKQPYQPPQQPYQPPPPVQPPQPQPPRDPYYGKGLVCQAMYDYDAADTDEVTFRDGDVIINCEAIDAGWMEGTVEKTGQRGMLPSNYVERLN